MERTLRSCPTRHDHAVRADALVCAGFFCLPRLPFVFLVRNKLLIKCVNNFCSIRASDLPATYGVNVDVKKVL